MKARKYIAGIWAVAMLLSGLGMLGILSVPVVAQPPVHFFSGSITFDGLNAPAGTYVYAEVDGTVYGQDSDQVGGGYDGSAYSLAVGGEDVANTTAKEGAQDGQPIIFWVNVPGEVQWYAANQAPAFSSGGITTLNLVVQSGTQPPRLQFNMISANNVTDPLGSWVQLYNPSGVTNVDTSADWMLEDSYGPGSMLTGVIPPMDVSPAPHHVNLLPADGNVKLVWTDPIGTVGGGNPIVMDKAEWGPHIGDTEGTGGDTIGLDIGNGPVWDPNLPNCPADWGYVKAVMGTDTDVRDDYLWGGTYCHPQYLPRNPELWPRGTLGYENDYLDPEIGDSSTTFNWMVWYAHDDGAQPAAGWPQLQVWDQGTGFDIPGSPFTMNPGNWIGAMNDWVHPLGGREYIYSISGLPIGTYCYRIMVTDVNGGYNETSGLDCFVVGDSTPPDLGQVLLNGVSSLQLPSGGGVFDVTVDVDDAATGNSFIGGAEYNVDTCAWPGTQMLPQDGGWDSPLETAFEQIDATGWPDGTYLITIPRAWDEWFNYNYICPNATLNIGDIDITAPNIYEPRVNGQTTIRVAPGTAVTFTAIIDDFQAVGPASNIGGATYSINAGPSNPMTAQDGAFDEINETVTATIDTTTMPTNSYQICVDTAWDVVGNYNNLSARCATFIVDGDPPSVSNLRLNGVAGSLTVNVGATVDITATVDDTLYGGSIITGADFIFDVEAPVAMSAVTPPFDSVSEQVYAQITTGVAPYVVGGPYDICVEGTDFVGNVGTTTPCAQLTIQAVDVTPPVISGLTLTPAVIVLDGSFDIEANADDSGTSPYSNIQNGSYDVRDSGGASVGSGVMDATDGTFDSETEDIRALAVDATGWPEGTYTVWVFACDVVPLCSSDSTTLTIQTVVTPDDFPPEISGGQANPNSFQEGQQMTVDLSATVDDTNTNGSNINNASYIVRDSGGTEVDSGAMDATDGAFDEVSEAVNITVNVSAWTAGTYSVWIFGSDVQGNHNTTGFGPITITVTAGDPPSISQVTISPTSPEEGDTVTVTATASDTETATADLTVTLTLTGPGTTITDQAMTYNSASGTFSYQTGELDAGSFSWTVTVTDEDGNTDTDTGTFTVEEKPGDGGGPAFEWWWILLIIIIIVVVIIIIVAATRRKPEEVPPEEFPPEELPPEEEMPPEEEAFVEEEAPPEEMVEEAPEEVTPEGEPVEEAPMEEAAPEETPTEEASPAAGPVTCPNCGTVNPAGTATCTTCGSPL